MLQDESAEEAAQELCLLKGGVITKASTVHLQHTPPERAEYLESTHNLDLGKILAAKQATDRPCSLAASAAMRQFFSTAESSHRTEPS